MDFDFAAQRLARDQSKMRSRTSRNVHVSERAKRQAEAMKRRQAQLAAEKEIQRKQQEYMERYYRQCERVLGTKSLSKQSSDNEEGRVGTTGKSLELRATSIYGEGDKIALPPSVLAFLTNDAGEEIMASPWTFRVGILNPNYQFPASPLLKNMKPSHDEEEDDSQHLDDMMENDDDDPMAAFLEELDSKYLAYTHASVVEFTQEEGHIGLPELISRALLNPSRRPQQQQEENDDDKMMQSIPRTRTVDPATAAAAAAAAADAINTNDDNDDNNNNENPTPMEGVQAEEEKTPGHLAWGAFEIPDMPIEITMVKLPKGKACQLLPTQEAIQNGFYNLKDIKLVLEQSLMRTRATLSTHDLVHSWHRGIKYDLQVTSVTPSTFQAVVCVNTDIEVEFDQQPQTTTTATNTTNNTTLPTTSASSTSQTLGTGRVLSSSSSGASPPPRTAPIAPSPQQQQELVPEPPMDQKENVCTVQIRGDGANARRRFDVTQATVGDLFAFAAVSVVGSGDDNSNGFHLVTRFPRRVWTTDSAASTLQEAGILQGQELFMVERI